MRAMDKIAAELTMLLSNETPPTAPRLLTLPSDPIVSGSSVGYLPSNWDVSAQGAFVYSIPLDMPDGHLTPTLSLAYSSANIGNGVLGIGWTLQGPSQITRCGENLAVDDQVTAEGRFCLDGQKLIAVPTAIGATTGEYGKPGTEYRTERESYARIKTVGDAVPDRFVVETRAGVVREYDRLNVPEQSGTWSSIIEPPLNNADSQALPNAATSYSVAAMPVTDRWLLKREYDSSGNALQYVWSDSDSNMVDSATQGIEVLLEEIRYTRKEAFDSGAAYYRKVEIEYEDREDKEFAWHLGVRNELRHRIKAISMYAPYPRTMAPVWTYFVEYESKLSEHSGRSRLKSVQRCGMLSGEKSGEATVGACLWKKEFTWHDGAAAPTFTPKVVKTFAEAVTWPTYDSSDPVGWANQVAAVLHPPVAHVLDLDGDGTDDMVLQLTDGNSGLPTHVLRGVRDPTTGVASALADDFLFDGAKEPGGRRDYVLLQTARPVDLDGDGRAELLAGRQLETLDPQGNPTSGFTYEEKLYGWGANGFGPSDLPPLFGVHGAQPKRFNFVDLDGDQRLDAVVESDGADSGNDYPFFWWNKTWEVWMNYGGTLTRVATTPLETKCASQITDSDGDGAGELIQRYDHDEVIGKSDADGVPWATNEYKEGKGGYQQYECTGIGRLNAQSAVLGATVTVPIDGKNASQDVYGRHLMPGTTYGDFNADGLEDEFDYQFTGDGQQLMAWMRWNTGRGYGPRVSVPDFFPAPIDSTWQVRQIVGDFNGDGRDDILSMRQHGDLQFGNQIVDAVSPTMVLMLSQGDGKFTAVPIDGGPGLFDASETYTTTRSGDFNGDGFPDLVRLKDPLNLEVLQQTPQWYDLISAVADEPTPWDRETVEYSNQWNDKPEPVTPCTYPLSCVRQGMTVVRKVLSRDELVDPSAADLADANTHAIYYSYEDPVSNLRGRGFLGFRKVRTWDPWRPIEIVREFDNRTDQGHGYYPGVESPIRTTIVVPFALVGNSREPPALGGASKPTVMLAHVTRTETVLSTQSLNKTSSSDEWGLTYDIHATSWITTEWEQNVSIDWGIVDAAGNPSSEHIYNPSPESALYSNYHPAVVLREAYGSAAYDDFGNVIEGSEDTITGSARKFTNSYENKTSQFWRIGELTTQNVTISEASQTGGTVSRTTGYKYDSQGRLSDMYREPGSSDPSLLSTTHLDYDDVGNVVSMQVTALNDLNVWETRETRFEYTPSVIGWPDERLYPSQIWSPYAPNSVAAYRPSSWIAVYPAFGLTVATMDANGVQSKTQYDVLGRMVGTWRDGAPNGTVDYHGRADNGGYNGLITSVSLAGQLAETQSDALGREIQSSDFAFDGLKRSSQRRYDGLGRLKTQSRLFPAGTTPTQFTKYAYDALNRVVKVTAPDSTFVHYEYPSYFETHSFDASNNESVSVRDANGRQVISTNMLNGQAVTTTYAYGPFGLDAVTDPTGNVTHTEYNKLGLPILQVDPDSGATSVAYTGFGQLRERYHQMSGDVTKLHYDPLGRLTHQTNADGGTQAVEDMQFIHDSAPNGIGRLAEAKSADNVVSRFAYDALSGRMTSFEQELDGVTDRLGLSYDSVNGHLTGMNYPSVDGSTNPGLSLAFGYNSTNYVDRVFTQQPGEAQQQVWKVVSRDVNDSLLTGVLGIGGAFTVARQYESQTGRVADLSAAQGNQTIMDVAYGYDPNGLVHTRDDKVAQRQEQFDYDELLRLAHTSLLYQGTIHNKYSSYDVTGNLLGIAAEKHLIGQPIPPLSVTDANVYGNQVNLTFPQPHALTEHTEGGITEKYLYDTRGRQVLGGGRNVTFNNWDLPKVIMRGGQKWTYAYDAFGTKVRESTPDGATTTYVGGIYERRTSPGKDTLHVFHIPGTDGRVADIMYNAAPPNTYTANYVLEDTLGSTSIVIDGSGAIERRHYDDYGKRINPDGTDYSGQFGFVTSGFTGHEHEDLLGLINMRGRIYDPKLKRFLSADPFVTHPWFGQSWNRYSYALNNPLNFTDPSGFADEQTCTNMANLSVCYPNTPTGNSNGHLAPGSEDDHCKSCGGPYNGDDNGSVGPGNYGAWAGYGQFNYEAEGRPGSRVSQSSVSEHISVSQSKSGGRTDSPLRNELRGTTDSDIVWQIFNHSMQPHLTRSSAILFTYAIVYNYGKLANMFSTEDDQGSVMGVSVSENSTTMHFPKNAPEAGASFLTTMLFVHEGYHIFQNALTEKPNRHKQSRSEYVGSMMQREADADAAMFTALGELFVKAQKPSRINEKSFYENANLMFLWNAIASPSGQAWTKYLLDHLGGNLDAAKQWQLAQEVGWVRVEGDDHRRVFGEEWDATNR